MPDARKLENLKKEHYVLSFATKELLHLLDLPTLQNCWLQEKAMDMYKAKNDLSPPCIVVDLFKLNNSDYHLRKSDFIIPLFDFSSIWQA